MTFSSNSVFLLQTIKKIKIPIYDFQQQMKGRVALSIHVTRDVFLRVYVLGWVWRIQTRMIYSFHPIKNM